MSRNVAIAGLGYTSLRPLTPEVSYKDLMFEAAVKAYEDAGYQVVIIDGFMSHGLTGMQDGAGLDCLTSEIRFPVRWADKAKK